MWHHIRRPQSAASTKPRGMTPCMKIYFQVRPEIDKSKLKALLTRLQKREVTMEEVLSRLETFPYEDLGFAKPDHHRALRRGFPEVILGQGKSIEQIGSIAQKLLSTSSKLLITRTSAECFEILRN